MWRRRNRFVANKFAPGLLDRILARTGYDGQQYNGAEDPNRAHNLFAPVPGDHGAHGDFNARARSFSAQWWMNQHRGWLFLGGAIAALVICSASRK